MLDEFRRHDAAVYAGYLTHNAELLTCTSGGIGTALAAAMLKRGGYVAGVVYSADFYSAEYILTRDVAELPRLKGSKYLSPEKKHIYKDIQALLAQGEQVLFFGLPCAVAALYQSLGGRPAGLVTCELICHGPMPAAVHRSYLQELERRHRSRVREFCVRRKKGAWTPTYLSVRFENGAVYEAPFEQTEYGQAFYVSGLNGCYSCKFKGNDRTGDLMIGDFWGATPDDPFYNPLGVSVIFAETETGNAFLSEVDGIRLFPTTFERAVEHNPAVIVPREKSPCFDRFAEAFAQKGTVYAARVTVSPKEKLRRLVVRCLPGRLIPKLRKIFSR